MARKRPIPLQIFKLASDLGLQPSEDPIKAIVALCETKLAGLLAEMDECDSLSTLLEQAASKAGTCFEIVKNDEDLQRVKARFVKDGERAFANLEAELSDEVFGVTFRLQNRKFAWQQPFVSIIDTRGDKIARSYFTKWHEIAHLLTLTSQRRLVFKRTHSPEDKQDPEERLMDIIAGRLGFFGPIFHRSIDAHISFEQIEKLRLELCPEASMQASLISFSLNWPTPCLLLRAELGFNKSEKASLNQSSFSFMDAPEPVLRAVTVTANEAARSSSLRLFKNMRVPDKSLVHKVFYENISLAQAVEDLADWTDEENIMVRVQARFRDNGVEALIAPVLHLP